MNVSGVAIIGERSETFDFETSVCELVSLTMPYMFSACVGATALVCLLKTVSYNSFRREGFFFELTCEATTFTIEAENSLEGKLSELEVLKRNDDGDEEILMRLLAIELGSLDGLAFCRVDRE